MSDAGKVKIYSLEESTVGTTPASAMNTVAAATGVSGGLEVSTVRSNVLRGDYVKPDTIRTQESGTLTVPFELQYGDVPWSDWLEGLCRSDWTAAASVTATDISFDDSDNSISSVGETLTVFPVGSWIRVAGSTSNDGFYRVTVSATGKLTLGAETTITTEIAGDTVTIDCDGRLRNGSTVKSYTLERYFSDLSSLPYQALKGLAPSAMTLDVPTGGLVTGSFSFMGFAPSLAAASSAGTGSANAASTTKTFSGGDHVLAIFEGGAAVTSKVSKIGLSLSSPIRNKYQLGQLGPWGIGGNSFEHSGSLDIYNDDAGMTLWNKFHADTATSLYFRLTRDGATYIVSLPTIKQISGNPDVGNVDSDVMLSMGFSIDLNATAGFVIGVDRFAAS